MSARAQEPAHDAPSSTSHSAGQPPDTDIRRLQAFAVHSLDRLDAQRQDIDRISGVVDRIQSEMHLFRDFMQETRDKAAMTGANGAGSAVSGEAAEILASNLSGIRRKANEVDELKMQLGMMKLRVKTLEDESRILKASTQSQQPRLSRAPSVTPSAADAIEVHGTGPPASTWHSRTSATQQGTTPSTTGHQDGPNKRLRSSLRHPVSTPHGSSSDVRMDADDPFTDAPIDPQLTDIGPHPGPSSSAAAAAATASSVTTPSLTVHPLSNGRRSLSSTPTSRPNRSPRTKRPILTNEKGERLRRNGEVDKRAAWNRQYAAERRAAQARAKDGASAGAVSGDGAVRSGQGQPQGERQDRAEQQGQTRLDPVEVQRETAVRKERERRVREAFEKEATVDAF